MYMDEICGGWEGKEVKNWQMMNDGWENVN